MAKVKKSENAELEVLQNDGEVVRVGDEDVHVKPFKFGQLLKALKYLANIGSSFGGEEISEVQIIQALTAHTEDMLSLLALATGKDRAYFDNIESEEGVDLALAAWRVNQSFFTERLLPRLQGLTGTETKAEDGSKS